MTLSSSMTSTAGSVTLEPTSPASLSTVRTSSTDAFSCLPPQRTIAYTENSLPCASPRDRWTSSGGPVYVAHRLSSRGAARSIPCADDKGYQTQPPTRCDCPASLTATRRQRLSDQSGPWGGRDQPVPRRSPARSARPGPARSSDVVVTLTLLQRRGCHNHV